MATVSLQTVFDDARRAIETGAADKAIGIAQHILVHFPHMIEGYRLLGEACLNASQPEQAADAFSNVLKADPENVAAYYGQGLALQSLEQRPAAITSFERALEIQPNLADLRTQLMRLYAETPGSAGQFRLSRAGLGRLYARGGMFSQAIDEFRAVLDADPDRDDVKVALAEALWRDGQEDEAMDYCRDLLEHQPALLKPTVLLGYMLFAAGQPEGETLWRRAAAQDATMALPRTLFDILPPIRIEEPVIPEFDEAEWRAQAARRASEAQPAAAPGVSEAEEDLFADSWLNTAGSVAAATTSAQVYDAPPVEARPATAQAVGDDDDLLASLLGFDVDEPAAPSTDVSDAKFSFDDWEAPSAAQQPAQAKPLPSSLDELGLEDDQPNAALDADLGAVKPFSFDDWSFDDEPQAPANPTAPTTAGPADNADLDNIAPFSFDEREPASADASAGSTDLGGVQPFSLDFDDEPAGSVKPFSFEDEPASSVKPFSLEDDDLGVAPFSLEDDETGPGAPTRSDEEAGLGAVQPFSLDEWGLDDDVEPGARSESRTGASQLGGDDQSEGLGNVQPFSLDELALDSLDDDSSSALRGPRLADIADDAAEPASFNWEEPTWRAAVSPGAESSDNENESIFAKLMRSRPAATESDAVPVPAEPAPDEQHFLSLDDETLRLDLQGIDQQTSTAEFDDPEAAAHDSAPAPQTELPALPGAQAPTQPEETDTSDAVQPFSLDELAAGDETYSWEADQPAAGAEAEELVPFSLSELGLSDDELASLGQEPERTPDRTPDAESEVATFSLSELGLSDDELAALDDRPELAAEADSSDANEPVPFSLADLGLTEDEIAALDLDNESSTGGEPAALTSDRSGQSQGEAFAVDADTPPAAPATEEPEPLPFSLADLGLTDDEIALLGDEPAQAPQPNHMAGQEASTALSTDRGEWDQRSSEGGVDAADSQAEWLDLQAELDVDLPATRTPDDYLIQAQVTDGDVQSVLETMPPEHAEDDISATEPFSLADLGLDDEELALFEQTPADQNTGAQPYPAPDDAARESHFADADLLEGLFSTEEAPAASDQAEGGTTFAASDAEQTRLGQKAASEQAPSAIDSEALDQPLPADLPEGAQPLAAAAEAPASAAVPAAQAAPEESADYGDGIAAIHAQLAADPENDALRLAVARMSQSMSDSAHAFEQYRLLVKRGRLLDEVVVDLQDTIAENEDPQMLRRLHRLLGDAYMKQNRIKEAMDEYSWTLPRS